MLWKPFTGERSNQNSQRKQRKELIKAMKVTNENLFKNYQRYESGLYCLHFLAVWTKYETFYFQIFCIKKRGNLLIRGKFHLCKKSLKIPQG